MKKATLLFSYIFHLALSQTLITLLQEDFETGTLPTGWRALKSDTSNGWLIGNNLALSSSGFNIPNVTGSIAVSNDDGCGSGCAGNADFLDTPVIPVTPSQKQGLFLRFKSYFTGQFSHRATVLISNNGWNGDFVYVYELPDSNPSTATWETISLDLSTLVTTSATNIAIRFWSSDDGYWGGGWAIDDVFVGKYDFSGVVPNCSFIVYPSDGAATDPLAQTLAFGNSHEHFGFPYGFYISFGTDNPPTNIRYRLNLNKATSWQTPTLQANIVYYWQITPYGDASAALPSCPVWSFTTSNPPYIGAKTVPYFENFEEGIGGWFPFSPDGTSSWTFGPLQHTIIRDPTGIFCWSTGNGGSNSYNPNENSFLISPPFDFTGVVGDLFINFKFWWNTEERYDGAIFQYSTDTLHPVIMNWTTIGSYSDGWSNWYDTQNVVSLPPPREGWSGDGPDEWTEIVHPLPGLVGRPLVYFRLLFTSDGSIQHDGVAIDDIYIGLRPATAPLCALNVFPDPGSIDVGLVTNLEWSKNPNDSPFLPNGYYLYVGTTPTANEILYQVGVTGTSFTLPDLSPGQTYYWKVVPYGVNNITPPTGSCAVWNFTTSNHKTSIPYFEDFETGLGAWAPLGTLSTWTLGTPNKTVINGAASPTHAWVTGTLKGDYLNYESSYVLSPAFDLSNYSVDPLFTAKIWWELENRYDGVNLQIRFQGETNWTTIGDVGDGENWYTSSSMNYPVGGSNTAWTGRNGLGSNGWVTASRVLTGAAGRRFNLRFAFNSDGSVSTDGFAFDDVHIKFPEDLIPNCPALVYPPNNAINVSPPLNLQWAPDYTIPGLPGGSTVVWGTSNPPTNRYNAKLATSYPIITDLPYDTIIYWKVEPYGIRNNTENVNCTIWSFRTAPRPNTATSANPTTVPTSSPVSSSSNPTSAVVSTSATSQPSSETSNAINPPVDSSSGGSSVNLAAAVAIPVIVVVAIAAVVGIIFLVKYMRKRATLHKKLKEISTELGNKE